MEEGENEIRLGDKVFNIGIGYVNLMVLKPLYEIRILERTAEFGSSEMDALEFINDEIMAQRRKEALERLLSVLKQLISDVSFKIKKEDMETLKAMRRRLNLIEKYISKSWFTSTNQVNHNSFLKINEDFFKVCLRELSEVKEDLLTPLNNSNLIFQRSDEMDINSLMDEIVEGG